ncbi:MAG: cofactor-independent phosphoglycerate mutase [Deltaproteobacteria bacterium]|nr:cofactor-independent phosphoglycerate mutase [Deltaproteobacteria bacterium]
MKYIILIGDGMADNPMDELGGKTLLEAADTPNLDLIASSGAFGLFSSVPNGFPPGSDVANLSILGYDPAKYYTGRAPLEAASIGVQLGTDDVAFRCNLVTIKEKDGSDFMEDYSSGHISTEEAREIIKSLDDDEGPSKEGIRFYTGTSYRHLMVWEGAPKGAGKMMLTPAHDISDKLTADYLPKGQGAEKLIRLMEASRPLLKGHPVNKKRESEGKRPATSIWLWGQGKAPAMPTLKDRFGIEGSIISAVDLMKGIGIYAGLEVIKVPGVTGYLDTNYKGKADYALASLHSKDFVCVHVEAPDEAGHNGNMKDKLRAIEDFDKEVVSRVLKGVEKFGEFTVLALTDHPTPVRLKTHTSDPVPFALYSGTGGPSRRGVKFSEPAAARAGVHIKDSASFIEAFFRRKDRKA